MVVVELALMLAFVAAGVGAEEVVAVLAVSCFVVSCLKEQERNVGAFGGIENCR